MQDPITLGLPHREPFIFVDEVIALVPGESAEGRKIFPINTAFFAGHFPGQPIVPGVILAEALAQISGIAAAQKGRSFLLSSIRAMKFPGAALPEEVITLKARKLAVLGPLWQFEVRATIGERVVAEGTIVLNET